MSKIDQDIPESMRLDKWLWCTRFYKTRSLAAAAIKSGKIKAEGSKVKAARTIKLDDQLTIQRGAFRYEITVIALAKSRGSATDAQQLYLESEQSITRRETLASQLKLDNAAKAQPKGRPNKQERRKIIRFTRRSSDLE
jgi:ribosome-associated heat shock protein Hsp15